MRRTNIPRMLQAKKDITIELAGLPSRATQRKVVRIKKKRKNGFSSFLNTMGILKTTWTGSDGKTYKCKHGEEANGYCINGVIEEVK